MPLHDHPNMSVFFRLILGNLDYRAYDKIDNKYKYNDFANDEYYELLMKQEKVKARKSRQMNIKAGNLLFVRPSFNNMHHFVAKENSCFFDICLPNYTSDDHTRKVTYYRETGDCPRHPSCSGLTELEYYTTPELGMPENFEINEINYRGSLS